MSPRSEPSTPQLDTDGAVHRPRSRSRWIEPWLEKYGDKLPPYLAERFARRASHSPSHSPEPGIGEGLARAGLFLGSAGSGYVISQSVEEVRAGSYAFLHALERAASEARTKSQGGVKRVNTETISTTIEVGSVQVPLRACGLIVFTDSGR